MDVSGQYHTLAALSPETKFRYQCIGGWEGPRDKLVILEKRELFHPAGIRNLDSLTRCLVTVTDYAIPAVLIIIILLLLPYLSFII
jgi:hypothetical protein